MSADKDFYSMSINELRKEYNESYDNPIKKAVVRQIIKEKYMEYKLSHNKKDTTKLNDRRKYENEQYMTNVQHIQNAQNNKGSHYSNYSQKVKKSKPKKKVPVDDYYEFTDDDFLDTVDTDNTNNTPTRKKNRDIYNPTSVSDQNKYNRKINNRTFELSDDDFNPLPNHGHLDELDEGDDDYKSDDNFKQVVENDYVNNNLMNRMNSEMEIRNKKNSQIANNDSFLSPYDNNKGKKELFNVYYNERTGKNFKNKKYN